MTGSKHVISWRRRTKERMINAFGNKCCICGHTFPQEVFEFHHLNPKNKEFSLGKIRSNCFSWERIVNELRKCVMACANCHRLIENGYVEVPKNASRFNELYYNYKKNFPNQKIKYDKCVCGKKKLVERKYCSTKCYHFYTRKVKRPPKTDLLILLEKGWSLNRIGKKYGVTHNAIKRWKKTYKL